MTSAPGGFHGQAPTRVLDTRNPSDSWARLGPGQVVDLPLLGNGGVPAAGVGAVAVNLTLTNQTAAGTLTVWPAGTAMPATPDLDYRAGVTVSRLVVATVGSGGRVAVHNDRGRLDLIIDVEGWFGPSSPASAGLFNPLVPARILDTRTGLGGRASPLGSGEVFNLTVAGAGNVPASGAAAVSLGFTAISQAAGGFIEAWPAGVAQPDATSITYRAGQTISNRLLVPLGTGGQISVYATNGPVDLIVDVGGWFTDGAATTTGGTYTPVWPARLLDATLGAGSLTSVAVAGTAGVPSTAGGALLVVRALAPSTPGYVGAFPAGNLPPLESDVSVQPGLNAANAVLSGIGGGSVLLYNAGGPLEVTVDVLGWFASAPTSGHLPSAPSITAASAASAFTASLSWAPPGDTGGSAITSYTVTATPGDIYTPLPGSSTSGLATGLACGVTYTLTVSATNAIGTGAASAPVQVATACSNVIQDVPYYRQVHELSCEEASLQMALAHEGISVSQDQILNDLVIDWRKAYYDSLGLRWGDAYANFVGDPDGSEVLLTGYGVYWSDIGRVAQGYGGRVLSMGENTAPSTVYNSILANHPVVAWVTFDWNYHAPGYYVAFDGTGIPYAGAVEHAVTLVGVTPDSVLVNNPWSGPQWVSKATFEASFATYHDMAVVLD